MNQTSLTINFDNGSINKSPEEYFLVSLKISYIFTTCTKLKLTKMRVIILLGLLTFAAALPAPLASDLAENEEAPYEPGHSPEKPEFNKFEGKDDNEYLVYPPEHEQEKGPEDGSYPNNNYGENHSNENHKEEENKPEEEIPVIVILDTNKPSFFANLFSHFPTFSWPPKFTWPSLPFNWSPFGRGHEDFGHHPYFYPQ